MQEQEEYWMQLPPTDSDEYNVDSEEEFVVHGLNQKQSHSYAEIYGEEEEEVDYCGGDESDEAVEEIEEQEQIFLYVCQNMKRRWNNHSEAADIKDGGAQENNQARTLFF